MDESKMIELETFGGEGVIEIGLPTLSMKVRLKNELGRRARMKVVNGEQTLTYDDIGDVEVLKALAYVRSAPFPKSLQGFLTYCDKLDTVKVGNGEALFTAINEAIEEVTASPGPLEDSVSATTEN